MKKVFVHAYCRQNLGDDMFVLRLLRRYPDVKFYAAVDPRYRTAFASENNLIAQPCKKTNRLVEQLHHRFGYQARVQGNFNIRNWQIVIIYSKINISSYF